MNNAVVEVRILMCEILAFCYSDEHRESLRSKALKDGMTLEEMISGAIAHRLSEEFEVRRKTNLN